MTRAIELKYPELTQHYSVGKPIGEGTFGKVRHGTHKLSGIEVTIDCPPKKIPVHIPITNKKTTIQTTNRLQLKF